MKYEIDGRIFEDAGYAAQHIIENLDDELYDEMLDECYGEIEICGLSYSASIALFRVDEIAYNCGKNDYYDSLYGDIVYELERLDIDEETDIYGFTVKAIEE